MSSASASGREQLAWDRSAEADATDAALARRAGAGDVRAAEALVLRHQAAVARLIWWFARQPAELDDLIQDTFLRMLRALPNWKHESPFAHWLLRIATNVGRDPATGPFAEMEPANPGGGGGGERPARSGRPGRRPGRTRRRQRLKELLAQLPPDARALLTLHHLEGWDLAHIAAHYGWTVTATKLRAWRALYREKIHEP